MLTQLSYLSKKIQTTFICYIVGLILVEKKKTMVNLASFFNISHDKIFRFLSQQTISFLDYPKLLIKIIQYFEKLYGKGWIIIDDTALAKQYAQEIYGISILFDNSTKHYKNGLCLVVLAWTNGKVTIPIKFETWLSKKYLEKDLYKTKIEYAQKLIYELVKNNSINFSHVLFDGMYTTIDFVNFLIDLNLKFVGRAKSCFKIYSSNSLAQLKSHPSLKFQRNERKKMCKANWNGINAYFHAFREKAKYNEWINIYLITNIIESPDYILALYKGRWHIETMFRSLKQLLGISQCQARNFNTQQNHFYLSFFAYSFLQHHKEINHLPNVETAAKQLQDRKINFVQQEVANFLGVYL